MVPVPSRMSVYRVLVRHDLKHALSEYGIASEIQAVGVSIAAPGIEPQMYGGGNGLHPYYNQDGTFNGHTILVVPAAGRLLDPIHDPLLANRGHTESTFENFTLSTGHSSARVRLRPPISAQCCGTLLLYC